MLRIAIQTKGRLNEDSTELLSDAGVKIKDSKRKFLEVEMEDTLQLLINALNKYDSYLVEECYNKLLYDGYVYNNFGELLDEVEAIVYSGTKINIDYFLDEIMDEDHQEDIFEYFKESESDDIEEAINELGRDYTEEEIRLVRIKFISELGN